MRGSKNSITNTEFGQTKCKDCTPNRQDSAGLIHGIYEKNKTKRSSQEFGIVTPSNPPMEWTGSNFQEPCSVQINEREEWKEKGK
jgi:hypothetical protein